ncbi:MAG: nicotinamide-nucleotide amidohydrolase family protein [Candidatus Omnitrophica bacterium]|jgi:PncC family amidohydrolase|nr:nicotinamide-nucleotide amidohydrolase family protein [Candidatus Omnitrophota bacterium]
MQNIMIQAHKLLLQKNKTVAVAESCTGGLVSSLLTSLPGSSAYFLLGVAAYSNKAKRDILKIPVSLLKKHGAVSSQVALAMAVNVRKLAGADFGIGITGIAGPGGGTPDKPVGTVYIAGVSTSAKICKKFHFRASRSGVRARSADAALSLLEDLL